MDKHRASVPLCSDLVKLYLLGLAFALVLSGCFGPSKETLAIQFNATIGSHKDRLIKELGIPPSDCTPLQQGEACEWIQKARPPFFEGPLEGTFPGDTLTYFLDSKGVICQWRFQGAYYDLQHSESQC